ncbi:putative Mg(2+) transport ATPase [bacterium BMS3Bbin07]|nr:putative Mg(2+) transport ATPase [bacterium BMS3Bbin07]HDH02601.1 MgtC/SapB family protein [Nitrospirota bacterium]
MTMTDPTETILRLLLGAVLGGIIGFERQSHGRPAGFRTHLIVSLASVLIMIVSDDFYRMSTLNPEIIRIDPARIAAGAITGVGFLGAGVIIKSGLSIQGLTTAACLWIVSVIGLAVGSGLYVPALTAFLITFFSLWTLRRVEVKVPRLTYKILTLTTEPKAKEEDVVKVIKEAGANIANIDYEMDRAKNETTYHLSITFKNKKVISAILERMSELSYIKRFYLRG